jgi:hypothetical protein
MRKLSVQQQNMAAEDAIRRHAKYWRDATVPPALLEAASLNGVHCARSIFLKLEVDFPGMPRLFGMLLTNSGRFIEFEIETDESHSRIELVEAWCDVTEKQNLNVQNRGTGIGTGALALKVLHELNASA